MVFYYNKTNTLQVCIKPCCLSKPQSVVVVSRKSWQPRNAAHWIIYSPYVAHLAEKEGKNSPRDFNFLTFEQWNEIANLWIFYPHLPGSQREVCTRKFRVQWEHVLSLSKTLLLNTGYWRRTEICWDTLNQPNNQTVLWNFRKDRIFKSLLIRNPLNCSNAKLCGLYLLHRYFKESTDRPLYRVHSYIFSSKYPKINSPCDKVRWQIRKFH